MGKGYNNFMSKKPFHPGSYDNIKRVWIAQQKDAEDRKKQDELRHQYEREQDLYNSRALVSTESKEKLSLNFMYEAPKGLNKEKQEKEEQEFKFEWQRVAPRENYVKNNADIRDQPFGIQVRNVKCLKCHNWGHINTDKECPLFYETSTILKEEKKTKNAELIKAMKKDGLSLKRSLIDPSEDNDIMLQKKKEPISSEEQFINSLTRKQKKNLLKKINSLLDKSSISKKKEYKK